MTRKKYYYEILFVNDGSTDETETVLQDLKNKRPECVKVINFQTNCGKTQALKAGFAESQGKIVLTMDADLQDDPIEIPRFIHEIKNGYDLVSGWKHARQDSFIKRISSRVYNITTSTVSGVYLHDHNCGFKAYRKDAIKNLPLSGQLHRFIPMLVHASGFTRITEIKVHHIKRIHGKSKYGLSRFVHGITGLYSAYMLSRKMKRAREQIDFSPVL